MLLGRWASLASFGLLLESAPGDDDLREDEARHKCCSRRLVAEPRDWQGLLAFVLGQTLEGVNERARNWSQSLICPRCGWKNFFRAWPQRLWTFMTRRRYIYNVVSSYRDQEVDKRRGWRRPDSFWRSGNRMFFFSLFFSLSLARACSAIRCGVPDTEAAGM